MTSNCRTIEEIVDGSFVDPYEPMHLLGPDYIIPTENIRTWLPNGAVKLEVPSDIDPLFKPVSMVTFMKKTVDEYPNKFALAVNRDGKWIKTTYKDYWTDIRTAARGFIKLGLVPFQGVGILGFNSPEWLISYVAAIFAGGIPAGIYTTNSVEASFHILNDSSANIAIVENDHQLQKILKVKDKLPHLKAIVQYIGKPTDPTVFSWQDLMKIGRSLPEDVLDRRIKGLAINQCSGLIYTSGTTGNSKGVMLNHDNLITTVKRLSIMLKLRQDEVIMSYLPLSHIVALGMDLYLATHLSGTVYFAPPEALKGKLVDVLKEVRPTFLLGVPRVFEKLYEKMVEAEGNLTPTKKIMIAWARRQVLNYHLSSSRRQTLGYAIAQKFVCGRLKKLIGFDRTHRFFGTAAPMPEEVQKYLLGLDIVIIEGYGLSESAGMAASNTPDDYCIGSVGKVCPPMTSAVKIENPDESGSGEILITDRVIFMGYLQLEDKTKETLDDDRWLHSGDMGILDDQNYLYITGRIKELLITAGGENIPPVPIEDAIKQFLPVVSNCILIGDRKKYLSMIITLKVEMDPETAAPTDRLLPIVIKWCKEIGSQAETVSEILKGKDPHVMSELDAAVVQYNAEKAVSNAQRIQKWKLIKDDFSVPGGELGPTGKMKRHFIIQKYAELIEAIYDN